MLDATRVLSRAMRNVHVLIPTTIGLALAMRLALAWVAEYPGHADYAFYYTLAENLADGSGLQIDYIWHYLDKPSDITHNGNDYWMPFTSVIISLFFISFGKSLFAALLPSILAGILLSLVTYFWARTISDSEFVALGSAALVLFAPRLFLQSLLTDSAIYYALFVTVSLYAMTKGLSDPRYFILAGTGIGLAQLTRQDGALLMPIILMLISRRRLKHVLLTLLAYVLILSSLAIFNYCSLGSPFPSGAVKTLFLTDYEDVYSYSKQLTLQNYLAWGWSNILNSKMLMAVGNLKTLLELTGDFLWVFPLLGLRKWKPFAPSLLFLGVLFCFYSFLATFLSGSGSFLRSSMSLIPVTAILSVIAIKDYFPSRRNIVTCMLGLLLLVQDIPFAFGSINYNTQLGRRLAALNREIGDGVIMTRDPWEVNYSTGHKAIQIPNDDLDTIYDVAQKYHARYLLLPAPRKALDDIYSERQTDYRFELRASVSDLKLFQIR